MKNKPVPRPGNLPENPKLTVCMIVRDEEKTLPRCLQSVKAVADELIVVDTGSKDNTVSIARGFDASVFHFEWRDDFAAARNESLEHASCDWILQIDADEELLLASIPYLRKSILNPSALCYFIRCDNGPRYEGSRFASLCRLFRNHPRLGYRRPYHEGIDTDAQGLLTQEPEWRIAFEKNIVIRHYGYEPSIIRQKYERGLSIMKSYLRNNPDDAYVLTQLGGSYSGLGRYEEAKRYLNRAIRIDPNYWEANYTLGVTLERQNELDAAIRYYQKAIAVKADFVSAHLNLGILFTKKGMLDNALLEFKSALLIEPDYPRAHYNLAIVCYKKGDYKKAITHCDRAAELGVEIHPQLLERLDPYR